MSGKSNEPTGEASSTGVDQALIMVVEDDERTLRLERFVLEEEGFQVVSAGSGEEALVTLSQTQPALVLLDIGWPHMDGFHTCEAIRETSHVPIIIVTGEDRDADKVRGLEMGADDYVTKPFSITELAARVKAVLRRFDHELPQPAPGGGCSRDRPRRSRRKDR